MIVERDMSQFRPFRITLTTENEVRALLRALDHYNEHGVVPEYTRITEALSAQLEELNHNN